jgi:hypothetical protein
MNPISNIWNHPKTSAAGLLIAVATIAGVFSRQGITLGNAGTGSVVTLISAVATALLGLLSRDPAPVATTANNSNSTNTATAKLGVLMLCALLVSGTMPMSGCSATSVAQDIVNWTPTLQSAVATVDSTASLLAPADAPIFTAATVGFDAASNVLVAQAKAYLANPTASILAQLQTQVVAFQQQVNAALLSAAKIVDPASQKKALTDINLVATVVNAMLALVASISSKAQVARMAAQSTVKLAQVRPYLDEKKTDAMVAEHYGQPSAWAIQQVGQVEMRAAQTGF